MYNLSYELCVLLRYHKLLFCPAKPKRTSCLSMQFVPFVFAGLLLTTRHLDVGVTAMPHFRCEVVAFWVASPAQKGLLMVVQCAS